LTEHDGQHAPLAKLVFEATENINPKNYSGIILAERNFCLPFPVNGPFRLQIPRVSAPQHAPPLHQVSSVKIAMHRLGLGASAISLLSLGAQAAIGPVSNITVVNRVIAPDGYSRESAALVHQYLIVKSDTVM
jgi:hypothetical protein